MADMICNYRVVRKLDDLDSAVVDSESVRTTIRCQRETFVADYKKDEEPNIQSCYFRSCRAMSILTFDRGPFQSALATIDYMNLMDNYFDDGVDSFDLDSVRTNWVFDPCLVFQLQ